MMKDHKEHIAEYKERLEKGICEYMQNPVSERSADAVRSMLKCWEKVDEIEDLMGCTCLSREDAIVWNTKMLNADGSMGGHWSMEETTKVAEDKGIMFEHIPYYVWNVAMNMMYSDYCYVADKFGVGTVDFYADMAKAFLFDKDGGQPMDKISAYYCGVVK